MRTEYAKNQTVKVIGRINSNSGGWKRAWTQDMYHTLSLNKNRQESPVLTVVKDDGLEQGVLCHDGNHWPHRVLEMVNMKQPFHDSIIEKLKNEYADSYKLIAPIEKMLRGFGFKEEATEIVMPEKGDTWESSGSYAFLNLVDTHGGQVMFYIETDENCEIVEDDFKIGITYEDIGYEGGWANDSLDDYHYTMLKNTLDEFYNDDDEE